MDAKQIEELRPRLAEYLDQFRACFSRSDSWQHLTTYVEGQLSDLQEKSCEPIALAAGIPPRNLQQFLAFYKWNQVQARECLQQIVARRHSSPHSIGVIDETSDTKKGDRTPGVQRQWCGKTGKKENCIVTVNLGHAVGDFHCLVDSDLYLPESWANDRKRCQAAGIPDDIGYRPKWKIALDLLDRTRAQGLQYEWLTFDEWYGVQLPFLRDLEARNQQFVGEVRSNFFAWIAPPAVTTRPFRRKRNGRRRKTPRVVSGARPAMSVKNMLRYAPELRHQKWTPYYIKDGEKGPVVWEAKHVMITIKDENDLPGMRLHLVVARNALNHNEIKFFVSNAPPETNVATILAVGFSRWHVERCFEDQKQEVGLDQWEGRTWLGLQRHLILTNISFLFLSQVRASLAEKKSGAHSMPSASCNDRRDSCLAV